MHLTQTRLSAISIHTPHAGSDPHNGVDAMDDLISIHTPHAGSDLVQIQGLSKEDAFQSTLPMRGATIRFCKSSRQNAFQSTLPMRGATAHADRIIKERWDFNPHSPCGERRKNCSKKSGLSEFQSTLPMRGATFDRLRLPLL